MPTVSVILNCYNHENYVGQAVESVLAQTFRDFELILIDNGSTDASRAVLDRFDDPRIRRFYHDENEALSRRLNQGVDVAGGAFVCVLYSDDMMLRDKLERQVEIFAGLKPKYGVVYCPAVGLNELTGERWVKQSMSVSGPMMPAMLDRHFEGAVDMCSPLIRRACFNEHRWHDDLPGDGEAIFFRMALDWQFRFDPEPTVVLRDHGSNWGKAVKRNHEVVVAVFARLADHRRFRPEWREALNDLEAGLGCNVAWSIARGDGDSAFARRLLLRSVRQRPSALLDPRTIGGLLLLLSPAGARRKANGIADRLRPSKSNRGVIA